MTLRFSVGMALYDQPPDFWESARAEMTIMSLLVHHREHVGEIILVDNNPQPNSPLALWGPKTNGVVRYVPMPSPVGTAPPRNRVFEEAKFDHVVVMDPHVLLYPGAFDALEDFYRTHGEDCQDVLHGPMMTEKNELYATHMNDQWREEMLGTWAWAWEVPIQGGPHYFSVMDVGDHVCRWVTLGPDGEQVYLDQISQMRYGLPDNLSYFGHECWLSGKSFRQPTKPFVIPGHGMGFWACRRDAWLPFHEKCRGFGGEEITTGKRFRAAGRKAWCVPGAMWWHSFHRPGNRVPYRLTAYDKIRNYCLEFARLGLDLEPIHQHFFAGRGRPEQEWEQAAAGVEWPSPPDGVNAATYRATPEEAHRRQLDGGGAVAVSAHAKFQRSEEVKPRADQSATIPGGIDALHYAATSAQSPINADLPHLKHLASICGDDDVPGVVVEIAHQSVSAISLMAGRPKVLWSYGALPPYRVKAIADRKPEGTEFFSSEFLPEADVPKCDLLFLDVDPHTSVYYYQLLNRHEQRSARFIVLHDTVAYGDYWNDQPGMNRGVEQFLADHPEWAVVAHHVSQNGLMVLSRRIEDKDKATAPPEAFAAVLPATAQQQVPVPTEGVGTELKALLVSLGINASPNCDCNGKVAVMNQAGVEWCKANIHTIVGWLKDGAPRWGWTDWVGAAARAVTTGLVFKVSWTDPFPGLVEEAVRRFEEKQRAGAA